MQESTGKAALARRDGSALLDRLLDTPHLAAVVPRLPPDTLHRLIDRCGLEACGPVVALATPQQIAQVFDLDLWRGPAAGLDAQFDAERFGVWLEVLVEQGAEVAARTIAGLDVDLVAAGLAQHVRVFDVATLEAYETTDGTAIPAVIEADGGLACDLAGRRLIARRPDAWDAIVEVLAALHDEHFGAFVRLMRACNALSHSRPEADGLDALLGRGAQSLYDLADAREQRREAQGFVSSADARAFLESSRRLSLRTPAPPPRSPVAGWASAGAAAGEAPGANAGLLEAADSGEAIEDPADASVAALVDLLRDEGVLAPPPRALLAAGPADDAARHAHLRRAMDAVFQRDPLLHAARQEELARLGNVLMAGGSLDARAFTAREASDAVAATCNLGLEYWPPAWHGDPGDADGLLLQVDLATVFQVGWTVLHDDVCARAAGALLDTLAALPRYDVDTHVGLEELRATLVRHTRAGLPWGARDALDVLAGLDQLVWITLLGLIAECPVLPATLVPATGPRRTVDPAAFAFVADRRDVAAIHAFLDQLPGMLRP